MSDRVNERENAPDQLAAIVESSDDAIIGKDLKGLVQTWNKGAERLYGYARSEMLGRTMELLLPADRADEESSILAGIQAGNRFHHFETTRRRKNGDIISVSLTISPIRNEAGEIIGASHIARDITERAKFERIRSQLAAIVESSRDAIVGKSLDGVVETWNRAAELLYGYSASEIIGRPIDILLPPDRPNEEKRFCKGFRRESPSAITKPSGNAGMGLW